MLSQLNAFFCKCLPLDTSGTFSSLGLFFYLMLYSTKVAFFLHLVYFYSVLAKLFLSEQKWNLYITFVLFYSPNTQFLTHICLFALEIKWNLFVTCSTLPKMNPSGTCTSLGSKSTWISLNKLFISSFQFT